MSISNYSELKLLDAVFNATAFSVTSVYVKLHIGNPGEDGTANPAVETTRKVASFAAASAGEVITDADLTWTVVAGTENYTHISLWDASTAGNHLWYGPLTVAYQVNAGDTFTLPAGNVTITLD